MNKMIMIKCDIFGSCVSQCDIVIGNLFQESSIYNQDLNWV